MARAQSNGVNSAAPISRLIPSKQLETKLKS
jgi:hypothetical protein